MHKKIIITDYDENIIGCDGFIFNSKEYSTFPGKTYSEEELLNLITSNKLTNYKLLLNIDKIIAEEELEDLKIYIEKTEKYFDYVIYSDYAIYEYIQDKNKLIYDSKTLVCSYQETLSLDTKTFLSLELSYEEIAAVLEKVPYDKVALDVFGLHQIMYSKRPLLTIYNDLKGQLLKENHLYDLKEELREDKYKIIQNQNGTFIYTPFYYAFMKKINHFDKVFMLRINSIALTPEIINKLILFYNNMENIEANIKSIETNINSIEEQVKYPIKEGFLTEKLFLLKDENDE